MPSLTLFLYSQENPGPVRSELVSRVGSQATLAIIAFVVLSGAGRLTFHLHFGSFFRIILV